MDLKGFSIQDVELVVKIFAVFRVNYMEFADERVRKVLMTQGFIGARSG